jgi:hypothetical protein
MKTNMEEQKEKIVLSDAEKIALFESDAISHTYFTVARKMNELNKSLNETVLDIASDDKVFDRFMKFVERGEDAANFLLLLESKLKERFKTDDVETTAGKATPILEQFVKNKKDGK